MGVVYLATDPRLDRQVAIKALPPDFAADPDRLARFQREAKVLAALNHSNVGGIHGLEEQDGQQYLVLEYIEGQTLADRLGSGPIALADALMLAKQIAEALEAAHEKGIVHRDLKPGNVMVTPEGVVKVLDFGLSRTADGSPSATNAFARPDSPTVTSPVRHSPTIPGVIMGTAGYMSPEQARGRGVDKRSDIFSFGCVLYEMLTGVMPFRGETVADAIGATLHKESDLNLLPPGTPRRVRELLANCLAKDRKNRLHDIGDARLELDRAINGQEWASPDVAPVAPERSRALAIGAAGLLALLAGGVGWLLAGRLSRPAPVAPAQTFHLSTAIPTKPRFNAFVGLSPDAKFLVYTAWPELDPESTKPEGVLVVRRLDRDETVALEGTEGARSAAMSADGRWLAFASAKDRAATKSSLKRVALDDGRPTGKPETVCDLVPGSWFNLGWASDREVVFAADSDTTIYAVPISGGEPRVVFREEAAKSFEAWGGPFRPLVPGKAVLATRLMFTGDKFKVATEALDLASGKRAPVLPDAGGAQLVPSGPDGGSLLLAMRGDLAGLVAVRFDPVALRTLGDPVSVWSGGLVNDFGLSPSGTLAVATQPNDPTDRRLAFLDDKGQAQLIPGKTRSFMEIAVSPDGGRVLNKLQTTNMNDLTSELWVQDLTRHTSTRIPVQGFPNGLVWSPDGQRFAYGLVTPDEFAIWQRRANGSGEPEKMFATPIGQQLFVAPSAWSPDGKTLAIVQTDLKVSTSDVLMLEQEAGGATWKATPYLNSRADEHALRFSPDGKWVVFCSVESGRHELYAQRFTGTGSGAKDAASGRVQLSTTGHNGACWWSSDGKEIRFMDGDKQVMSVDVQIEPSFSASMPKPLYSLKDLNTENFSWTPDGRLMVILKGDSEQPNKINLVVNFMDELRAKLGPAK